jgi:hypothetical protein
MLYNTKVNFMFLTYTERNQPRHKVNPDDESITHETCHNRAEQGRVNNKILYLHEHFYVY